MSNNDEKYVDILDLIAEIIALDVIEKMEKNSKEEESV